MTQSDLALSPFSLCTFRRNALMAHNLDEKEILKTLPLRVLQLKVPKERRVNTGWLA